MDDKISLKKFNHEDVVRFYRDIVLKWKPSSEVWAFKHGNDLTSGPVILTSFYLTHFFRKQMKLRSFARLTCYMPAVGLPSIGCYIAHSSFVTADILTRNKCPLCITTKALILQLTAGIFYPLIMAPVITFYMADKLLTYPIPSISRAPKEVLKLWLKLIKKNPRPLFISAAIQVFTATLVTQQKMSFIYRNWS